MKYNSVPQEEDKKGSLFVFMKKIYQGLNIQSATHLLAMYSGHVGTLLYHAWQFRERVPTWQDLFDSL